MRFLGLGCSIVAAATVVVVLGRARRADDSVTPPYENPALGVEQHVEDLLARMTLEEKLEMLSGTGFDSRPNERLGIPALRMTDGPQGVRMNLANPLGAGGGPDLAHGRGVYQGRSGRRRYCHGETLRGEQPGVPAEYHQRRSR